MKQTEDLRHAHERGMLLRILAEDYTSPMTSVGTLRSAIDMRGYFLKAEQLAWHLQYLLDGEYVKVWRTQDMPGFRRDRESDANPNAIRFARILPKGIQLIDGDCAEDPKVKF